MWRFIESHHLDDEINRHDWKESRWTLCSTGLLAGYAALSVVGRGKSFGFNRRELFSALFLWANGASQRKGGPT
jgi:hypothetical protein